MDGSPVTGWQSRQITASLTVPLAHQRMIRSVSLDWGQQYPPPPAPNVHPPPGPVKTLRATSYHVAISVNGADWTVAANVPGRGTGTHDALSFPPVRARFVSLGITAATYGTLPMPEELTVPGS